MFRSVTSDVSALSGIVANGHQTMHLVSPIPSKIPYGGFSPVRLQTRFRPRPPSRAGHCTFIGRHRGDLQSQRLIRSRSCDQSAPRPSDIHRESSGPWLPNRLSCPVGSSLTMATSAPLSATRRLIILYSAELRVAPANRRGSPLYSASPFTPCRRPYSGGSRNCMRRYLHRGFCLRRISSDSATTNPTIPKPVGSVTELQRSLDAAAWRCCLPCFGQGFYDRAFTGRVTPIACVGYHWMVYRHFPSPDFHRLD